MKMVSYKELSKKSGLSEKYLSEVVNRKKLYREYIGYHIHILPSDAKKIIESARKAHGKFTAKNIDIAELHFKKIPTKEICLILKVPKEICQNVIGKLKREQCVIVESKLNFGRT